MPLIKILYVNTNWSEDNYDVLYQIADSTDWATVTEEQEQLLLNNTSHIPTGRYDKAIIVRADDSVDTTIAAVLSRVAMVKAAVEKRNATNKAKAKLKAQEKAKRDAERKRKQLEQLKKELGEV